MDLKKIIHEWNVDKIIRDANIQRFKETGHWQRGPEPNFEVTERVIGILLGAVIEMDERITANGAQAEFLLEKISELVTKMDIVRTALMQIDFKDRGLLLAGLV